MKIAIIGSGPAGVSAAISLKRKHPNYDVVIFEHLDKALKKILATGNGKCNLGNTNLDIKRFNNPDFVNKQLSDYAIDKYISYLGSLNIQTKYIDNLLYPNSESAVTVRNAFLNECDKLGIKINLEESIIEYVDNGKVQITTNKGKYEFDILIFATGAKSSPQLGSDGSIYSLLEKHNYKINKLTPSLCPIKTKEKLKILDGVRVKAKATLYKNNKEIFVESGEVLFKEHGLSGIVIFNIMQEIAHSGDGEYKISLDLLPNLTVDEIEKTSKNRTNDEVLEGYLHPSIVKYFKQNGYDNDPIKYMKNLSFTYQEPYGFEFSHVSAGGVSLENINDNFKSKLEPNVYFLGEVLDIDGPCGGYNLTWIIYSSSKFDL